MSAKKKRGRVVVGIFGVLVIACVVSVLFFQEQALEQWHLLRLRYAGEASRDSAALALGELKSKRAIQPLIEVAEKESDRGRGFGLQIPRYSPIDATDAARLNLVTAMTDSAVFKALYDIGEPARAAIKELKLRTPKSAGEGPSFAGPATLEVFSAILDGGVVLEYSLVFPVQQIEELIIK